MTNKGKIMMIVTKSIITVFLLGAMLKMPYGYYQVSRLVATGLFCLLGYIEWHEEHLLISILCWISAAIFQPLGKIDFTKNQWHEVDLIFSGLLIIWIVADFIIKSKKTT